MDTLASVLVLVAAAASYTGLTRPDSLDAAQVQALLGHGAKVIDVRTPAEFRSQHLPVATNMPLDTLADQAAGRLPDKNTVLLLHCRSGARSSRAKQILDRLGYRNVHDLGSYDRARGLIQR